MPFKIAILDFTHFMDKKMGKLWNLCQKGGEKLKGRFYFIIVERK